MPVTDEDGRAPIAASTSCIVQLLLRPEQKWNHPTDVGNAAFIKNLCIPSSSTSGGYLTSADKGTFFLYTSLGYNRGSFRGLRFSSPNVSDPRHVASSCIYLQPIVLFSIPSIAAQSILTAPNNALRDPDDSPKPA